MTSSRKTSLSRGKPKIADFGLARSCTLKPITRSVDVMGTPPYMSPEHFMDLRRTDERADVYYLGKILFEAASGKFGSTGIPFKQAKLKNPGTAFYRELDRIIQYATVEEKKERLPSVGELKRAIESVLKEGAEEPVATESNGEDVASPVKALPSERVPAEAGPTGTREAPRWRMPVMAAVVLILSGLILLGALSYLGDGQPPVRTPASTHPIQESVAPAESTAPSATAPSQPFSDTATRKGKDEAVLHFVAGGKVSIPAYFDYRRGESVQVDSFYMDETPVTNHQYVEFLNGVSDTLTVENGVVMRDGEIWLMLGEVIPGYEPIVFRGGRFHVKEAHHAACPVLRVTGYGAAAYAHFYSRRLPTELEWLRALGPDDPLSEKTSNKAEVAVPVPAPVLMFKPNAFGIRELNANIGEWGMRRNPGGASTRQGGEELKYVVLGGTSRRVESKLDTPAPVYRYPWEAFAGVGFRCVQDASK